MNYTVIITRLRSSCLPYVLFSGNRCSIYVIIAGSIFTREAIARPVSIMPKCAGKRREFICRGVK
jgi:hypothetical protein